MANETLILGNNNWAVKTSNLLGYAIGETSGEYVPREFTFSRGSTATFTGSNGLIQTANSNIARVQSGALLLEPQRTNLALYSEQFDNAYWIKSLGNISANQTIAPDGTTTADLFTKTSGVNTVAQVSSPATIFQATGVHTLSVYIKPNVGNTVLLRLDNAGNAANFGFNFTTKTFSNSGANVVSSSYDELSNGWFRLKVTGNVTSTSWNLSVCNLFSNPTNDSMYIWGAQLEVGAYATTYIPTTTATITRLADSCIFNNFPGLSSQQILSFSGEFTHSFGGRVLAIGDGSTNNRFFIGTTSTRQAQIFLTIGTTILFFLSSGANSVNIGKNKFAVKIKTGDISFYLNGTQLFSNTTVFTLSGLNNIYIGTSEFGVVNDTQLIDSIRMHFTELNNIQLQQLTI